MSRAKVRASVEWFATSMEVQLRVNDYKGGWKNCDLPFLLRKLEAEFRNLSLEVTLHGNLKTDQRPNHATILRKATDLANFAMMIADNCRPKP